MNKLIFAALLLPSVALAEKFLWDPPTSYVDGAALNPATDIKEYYIYDDRADPAKIKYYVPGTYSSYTVSNLPVGQYRFTIVAVDKKGARSEKSAPLEYSKSTPNQAGNLRFGQ